MKSNKNIQNEIARILREIGNDKCLDKAKTLEDESSSMSILHLRDLALNSSDIGSIVSCLNKEEHNTNLLKSISVSYNPLLGDTGVIILMKNLPKSICEIGLVNCGIGDIGGNEILNGMRNLPNLQMVCIEQNNFSEKLRSEFKKFSISNPQILFIY